MVDEVPLAVILDRPETAAVQVKMQGAQGGFQEVEDGIRGRVVEVPASDDPVDAGRRERIRQEPQTLHRDAPPGFRLRRAPVF